MVQPSDAFFLGESALSSHSRTDHGDSPDAFSSALGSSSGLPRVALVSTHGYVGAQPPFGAADTGGQVVYVLELAKKLAQLGYEVDVWTRQFEQQPALEFVNARVRVIRVPCGGGDFLPKEYLSEHISEWSENALRFIQRHGLGYVFVNSHYWDGGLAGQRLGEALNVPHVHTPHSLGLWKQRQMEKDYPTDQTNFERQYNFARRIEAERRLYTDCQLLVATTQPQFDLLIGDYDVSPAKVRMIPPGYDDQRFFPVGDTTRETVRQRLGFSGAVVLAVGRLARNKGYDLLIDSFGLVAERRPEASLYLAVGGADMNSRERQLLSELRGRAARCGYGDRIHFGSFIPDHELADYYRAADAFVLSSRYEPFGMTAIEAMACGTPTIVTVHGGLCRALSFGRHALFADPFDKEDLGITITKVFRHDRLRTRLARMGAHKARSLFTWTGIAQQIVSAVEHRPAPVVTLDDQDCDEPWNDGD